MVSNLKQILIGVLASITLFINSAAWADSIDLRLDVGGMIRPAPVWRNENKDVIDNLSFNFNRISNTIDRFRNVDSDIRKAMLDINGVITNVSIEMRRPKECFIGDQRVADGHVYFVHGLQYYTDGMIPLRTGVLHDFYIRFSAIGGYAHLSGAVVCQTPGRLRYTYD